MKRFTSREACVATNANNFRRSQCKRSFTPVVSAAQIQPYSVIHINLVEILSMKQPKRVRRSHEQWQEIVEQYQSSELSAPKFCAEHGISYASFSKWRHRLSNATEQSSARPAFVELTSPPVPQTQWHIELDLAPGIQLRIAQPA